jgi:hypothetical protein
MSTVGGFWTAFAVAGSAIILGCADPLAVEVFSVDVDGAPVVSPMEQAAFQVTAVNRGNERVTWGTGSSSCQLGLTVQDADAQRHSIDFRICTSDQVEQGLDPGASRTETFLWGGWIVLNGETRTLPSGEYRVRGVAGEREESAPILVTVLIP